MHASKYKVLCNKPTDGCLWKPAKRHSIRASKQLRFVATTETFNGNQALVLVVDHTQSIITTLFVATNQLSSLTNGLFNIFFTVYKGFEEPLILKKS